jgi:hypothetical protein
MSWSYKFKEGDICCFFFSNGTSLFLDHKLYLVGNQDHVIAFFRIKKLKIHSCMY